MPYDYEDDNIVSVDMYVNQRNFNDVDSTDDVECYITRYDSPQIQETGNSNYGPWSDNAHLVFDVPKLPEREW